MISNSKRKKRLIEDLKDKEQRDAFVSAHIDTGIPFQIRALRDQRDWSQKKLGEHIPGKVMTQENISRLEDPNYSKFTLKTLKRLASAFDVALMVRFVPFSKLVEWELNLSVESLEVPSFDEESYFQNIQDDIRVDIGGIEQYTAIPEAADNIISFDEFLIKREEVIIKQSVDVKQASYG